MRKLIGGLMLAALSGPVAAAPDVTGLWMTQEDDGAVLVESCGAAVCGRLVWLREPLGEDGQPLRDDNNADARLRGRPLCGIQILSDAAGGSIYDPESGSTYSLALALADDNTLSVTGFVGIKAIGKTVQWHRAPAGLKRCDAPAPAGPPKKPSSSR